MSHEFARDARPHRDRHPHRLAAVGRGRADRTASGGHLPPGRRRARPRRGWGWSSSTLESPSLQVIATLGLAAGALHRRDRDGRRRAAPAAKARRSSCLGPGTLAARPRSSRSPPGCCSASRSCRPAILGAALASTDPVLLRSLMRHPSIPPTARLALRLESGMNDVILLPIVVLCMLALGAAIAPA